MGLYQMRVIISDTSCLIDFRKASLLNAFVHLPYELFIPDVLFEEELIGFSDSEKELLRQNLRISNLPGESILRVQYIQQSYPALTLNDCFAFVLAEQTQGCILMTGDKTLRGLANRSDIEVHGVLWGIDEMHSAGTATLEQLYSALLFFNTDSTVRLPRRELNQWLEKYQSLMDNDHF